MSSTEMMHDLPVEEEANIELEESAAAAQPEAASGSTPHIPHPNRAPHGEARARAHALAERRVGDLAQQPPVVELVRAHD